MKKDTQFLIFERQVNILHKYMFLYLVKDRNVFNEFSSKSACFVFKNLFSK